MANGKFVSYLRVSTRRQGANGLGIEAQRQAVAQYLNGGDWQLVGEVVEVESGRKNDRPMLAEAFRLCRVHGATLVIARLDRLSRDAAFLMNLQNAGIEFVAADMPHASRLTVGIMGLIAEEERRLISARTRAALAAAKARGTKLGGDRGNLPSVAAAGAAASRVARQGKAAAAAADLGPIIKDIRAAGATSLRDIADELNARGIPAPRGGTWGAVQVSRTISRAGI